MADSSHTVKPETYNGVSTLDEPSAAWGWHGISRRAIQISGWCSVLVLLLLNFGNHQGHVETIWLLGLAVVLALGLVIQLFQPKLHQVRTISARNEPIGHIEPDWTYDQATLSGKYADLNDAELRSLNIDPERVKHLSLAEEPNSTGKHALNQK